ncbi:MAG: glucose-6-phosphate isomerase, partial [Sporichthyaceae bacterium]|nr:glucose-6-phosphate isomerase [Sporichthyaceae bacterium]
KLAAAAAEQLVADNVPAQLQAKDPQLWGLDAATEAARRLGWLDLPSGSRALLPQLDRLHAAAVADGMDHIVLAGMGGSSLAPEVICTAAGVPLTVLDTTDPEQIANTVTDRLDRTVVVLASKSGTTIEVDSLRRLYEQAFHDAGETGAQLARHFVVVTDPGTPLANYAEQTGPTLVLADPDVGGRYSALTAFGLVPSALAGADVADLLDDAAALASALDAPSDNPGLQLGAALGAAAEQGKDKLVLAAVDAELAGLPDWIEQLIAESTGKHGRGILPVVVDGPTDPAWTGAGSDPIRVALRTGSGLDEQPAIGADLTVTGPLGAQFLLWEYATAIVGRLLGINPFDQPNVTESKDNTSALLNRLAAGEPLPVGEPLVTDGAIAIYADRTQFPSVADLPGALAALATAVPPGAYLAITAFLDRHGQAAAAGLRPALARRLAGRAVTFGWGPRYLHSTGQYHKGGPPVGSFLQITGEPAVDIPVPGQPFTFGTLQLAQALGDLGALTARGRTVVRLHLLNRRAGVAQLLEAAEDLASNTGIGDGEIDGTEVGR